MGKRTKDKSDEEIRKKIRRLEDELRYRQNISPTGPQIEDREDIDCESLYTYDYREELELDEYDNNQSDNEGLAVAGPTYMTVEAEQAHAAASDEPLEADCESQQPEVPTDEHQVPNSDNHLKSAMISKEVSVQDNENSVPTEILAILGEAKKSTESLGKKIPSEVSELWGQILVEGLAKDQKELLITKTLIPENFRLTKAPKLNAEVSSVLTEPAKNRDRRLERMQNQLGCGLARLVNLTAELIDKDLDKVEMIKRLSEINQILLDLHYEETINRRRLILPMLDKSFINVIQGVKRDDYLFGNNLGDNIKNMKMLERTSLQIKKQFQPQPNTSRKQTTTPGQPGNLRGPPRGGNQYTARPPFGPHRYYTQPLPPPQTARRPPPPPRRPPQSHPQSRSYDRRSRR